MTTTPAGPPAGEPDLPADPGPVRPELPGEAPEWTQGPHNDPVEPA